MSAAKGAARGAGAPSQQTLSIRNRHIACLETLLNFNNPVDSKTSWQESWKILIYDTQCRDIISTLFKVADLRKHGVTLHLSLHSDRQPVQDVAALYLVEPTPENVQRIARDCSSGLYDSMHLNWSSSISQEQLHTLAAAVAEGESAQRVAKVVDQYMDFISLDHTLFSLNMPNSFVALNDPQVSDTDMERTIAKLVNSLFSVVVTLGVLPYISCPSGGAAGMVGDALNAKLSEHVRSTNNLFKDQAFGNAHARPVLIILERQVDLSVNLHHPWTYEAMLHDLLGMHLNKVTVSEPAHEGGAAKPGRVYDLSVHDAIWVDNSGRAFPNVTDDIEERLSAWKAEYERISNSGTASEDAIDGGGGGIDALTKAAQLVPELTERKRLLDMHTSICTALLHQINDRELDNLYSLESAILSGTVYNAKSALMQACAAAAKGTSQDKMRLFLVYYLCNPALSESELSEYETALKSLPELDASLFNFLRYLRKVKALESGALTLGAGLGAQGGGGGGGM